MFNSITGWTSSGNPIEIGLGTVYGVSGYDGRNVLELDSTGNAVVSQVVGLTAGNSYTLSFLAALRANVAPASGTFEVYWNGGLVGSYSPTSTVMTTYAATVTAVASNTLEFRGTGTSDSYGAIIDNVSVPDGGVTSILPGMAVAGLGVLRRIGR